MALGVVQCSVTIAEPSVYLTCCICHATGQPLLERHDEEEGTSAGLDGEAPRQQGPMTAGAPD